MWVFHQVGTSIATVRHILLYIGVTSMHIMLWMIFSSDRNQRCDVVAHCVVEESFSSNRNFETDIVDAYEWLASHLFAACQRRMYLQLWLSTTSSKGSSRIYARGINFRSFGSHCAIAIHWWNREPCGYCERGIADGRIGLPLEMLPEGIDTVFATFQLLS